jgi:hypothetical protein
MNKPNALVIDDAIQNACRFTTTLFEQLEKPNFEDARKKIIHELSNIRLITYFDVINNLIYHFDNLTLTVFNLKNFNIGPLEISWIKSIISKISASWNEAKNFLSEDQLASYNLLSDQNLEYAKQLNALEVSYFIERSTKNIIDNLSSTKPNIDSYYKKLTVINKFFNLVTIKHQLEYLKLVKVLAALRLVDNLNFNRLKDLAFVLAKHLSLFLHPLSDENQIKESSLRSEELYAKEQMLIDSLVSNYPVSSLEIEELSQFASQISELGLKENFPKFFKSYDSFFHKLIVLKDLHDQKSAASLMYGCLTNALDLYKNYFYKLSIEDIQYYLNYLKDMTDALKKFLEICPLDYDIKPNFFSNANQIVADFNQDFRDIISILSKIM